MELSVNTLLYLYSLASKMKARRFCVYANKVFGMDDIPNVLAYTELDQQYVYECYSNITGYTFIVNKETSQAIKNMFPTDSKIDISMFIERDVISYMTVVNMYKSSEVLVFPESVLDTNLKDLLYGMNSTSGGKLYLINNLYHATVNPSFIPVTKSDKVYTSISFISDTIFVVKYTVVKAALTMNIIVRYLRIAQ